MERLAAVQPTCLNSVTADGALAPARATAPEPSVEATRALAAQLALQRDDIGSMQEDRLLAIVAAGSSLDETSDDGSGEPSGATKGAPGDQHDQ